ncbi:MAG: tetratricopeptide repeat protein [Acidobacteria bacterium]|nr:MAG: tetratricopeptide repeat protein [Acidobacteriota bacterium]
MGHGMGSLKIVLQLVYTPARALDAIRIGPRIIVPGLLALVANGLTSQIGYPSSSFAPATTSGVVILLLGQIPSLLFLALIFVPVVILVAQMVGRRGQYMWALRVNYRPVLSMALYAWAVSHLVVLPVLWLWRNSAPQGTWVGATLSLAYFGILMLVGVSRWFELNTVRALGALALSTLILLLLPVVGGLLRVALASPLLLIILFFMLRGYLQDIMAAQRARRRLESHLKMAVMNPADASAHYDLALLYEERGQLHEAIKHFTRAIEIDPEEVDAHYHLGRIALHQGRLSDAILHFDATVRRDPGHAHYEVWRDVGQTYLAAGQFDDARFALEKFLEHRPHDAQGLYYYGLVLDRLGQTQKAVEQMHRVVETVRTSPRYKYRLEKRWMDRAKEYLKSSGVV